MRWNRTPDEQWRRWFAWYPVLIDDQQWVWLEVIEYRVVGAYRDRFAYRVIG